MFYTVKDSRFSYRVTSYPQLALECLKM